MNGKLIWSIFGALVAVFIAILCLFFNPEFRDLISGTWLYLISFAVFFLLNVALIFLTLRERVSGRLKAFFLLTGASAGGVFVSILLHNLVYALFVHFFGSDFWNGGDELFFFTLAIFICPLGFVVGAIGSIVLRIKSAVSR